MVQGTRCKVQGKRLKGCAGRQLEFGIGTRRRPIGRDYAAAKDAASGLSEL